MEALGAWPWEALALIFNIQFWDFALGGNCAFRRGGDFPRNHIGSTFFFPQFYLALDLVIRPLVSFHVKERKLSPYDRVQCGGLFTTPTR